MKKHVLYLSIFVCLVFSFLSFTKVKASSLPYNLRGSFLIQVDSGGRAWYVDTDNTLRHSIERNSFSSFVSKQGLGITNKDLEKIPVAVNKKLVRIDSDGDGLDDRLELAIGTNPYSTDTDNDSHSDYLEIINHFNPRGAGRLNIDLDFTRKLAGRILLQVEGSGEAWYVNAGDNLRYYIADFPDLLKIIALTGKGINTENLNLITDAKDVNLGAEKKIVVDVGKNQRLYYYLGEKQIGSFPVSSGKASTPTPKGEYKIINKHLKAWSSYGLWMPYWMGLKDGSIGLHELPIWPNGYREGESHLGIPVSHGCVRLGIGAAEFLYNWSEIGSKVIIN